MVTAGSIAKFGAAIGAGAVVALGMLGSGRHAEAQSSTNAPAQPAISAPGAATSADIAALREHFDKRFDTQAELTTGLDRRIATVEGYMKAQQDAELRKALGRR